MKLYQIPRLVNKILFNKNPQSLTLFVTSRCNAKCNFCFFWKEIEEKQKHELTLEEYKKIAKNYGSLIQLSLTGGEPFLRKDLYEIMEIFYRYTNPMFVTVVTNGTFTERIRAIATKFVKNFPRTHFRISLSIDNIGEKHDKSRMVKGLFEKLLESYNVLDKLREKYDNISVDVGTTFTKYNQDEAEYIADWVKNNLKIDNHYWTIVRGNPKDVSSKDVSINKYLSLTQKMTKQEKRREKRPLSALWRAGWEIMAKTNYIILKENKMVRYCRAGKNLVEIYDNGDVHFCEILNKPIGNIKEFNYDMKKILSTTQAKNLRKWIRKTKCYCTFECANITNIAFNPKTYPLLIAKTIKNIVKGR